ncbi:MAG TPA: hypothetical protein PLK34_00195 [Candidatus Pacearchaeota archaeon]|nr:hypothetical protein [Candidatus Pacearchaeota archaeon]
MGLFKSKKIEERPLSLPELPRLPELDFNSSKTTEVKRPLQALPSFPSSSLGNKFSQNTIKDAVSGEVRGDILPDDTEELEEDYDDLEDYDEEVEVTKEVKKIASNSESPRTKEILSEEMLPSSKMLAKPSVSREIVTKSKEDSVFIKLEKFEESLDLFTDMKKQLVEAEKLLNKIKEVKEQENDELVSWTTKMESMKNQIERIDKNIFSKI